MVQAESPLLERGLFILTEWSDGEMIRRRRVQERKERKGFILLLSAVAAVVLMLILLKVGIPGLSGVSDSAIKLSMLSDAKVAVNAEYTCVATYGGNYVPGDLVNTSAPNPERDYLDKDQDTCPNVYIVASPGNHVHISTYQDSNGRDCFIVTVTNQKLQDVEAYYDSCDDTHSAPYIRTSTSSLPPPPTQPLLPLPE